jgi:dTDP-4-dehydrorhamnose 3,5-epimerase
MPFLNTGFPGLVVYEPTVRHDERGYFYESYNQKTFYNEGITSLFVQDNQVRSVYGVIRGLHYQLAPHAQAKLVRVLEGTILDVAVDLRRGSPSFGKVFSIELSAENKKQLLVPRGFAHGYSVLSQFSEVLYKCDDFYNPAAENGITPLDDLLSIDWKIPPDDMIISPRDLQLPLMEKSLNSFTFGE